MRPVEARKKFDRYEYEALGQYGKIMLYQSYGKLIYEADVLKTKPIKLSENWIVARACNDLVEYYQYWLTKKGVLLRLSSWKPHLSVVRGEQIDKAIFEDWKKQNGNKIYFDYSDELKYNKRGFIWIDTWSKQLNDLRQTLGLYSKKDNKFHLTIAKLKEGITYHGIEKLLTYDP